MKIKVNKYRDNFAVMSLEVENQAEYYQLQALEVSLEKCGVTNMEKNSIGGVVLGEPQKRISFEILTK